MEAIDREHWAVERLYGGGYRQRGGEYKHWAVYSGGYRHALEGEATYRFGGKMKV